MRAAFALLASVQATLATSAAHATETITNTRDAEGRLVKTTGASN